MKKKFRSSGFLFFWFSAINIRSYGFNFFQLSGFGLMSLSLLVGTKAMSISILWKPDNLQKLRIFYVSGFWMVGYQIPTVHSLKFWRLKMPTFQNKKKTFCFLFTKIVALAHLGIYLLKSALHLQTNYLQLLIENWPLCPPFSI